MLRDKKPCMHIIPATKSFFTVLAESGDGQAESTTLKLDWVNIAIAIAILEHVAGNLDEASAAWQHALVVSKRHHASPGYTDMAIVYSAYEWETRRGDLAEASLLEAKAKHLFAATGRQYYFTSHVLAEDCCLLLIASSRPSTTFWRHGVQSRRQKKNMQLVGYEKPNNHCGLGLSR
ncbi:hypothetical protein PG994_006958 [Apiospora phragmitis]|uniref:Uncharacterized protein n=1 Tax=Apiospora phragmitis TaxID=2905665 RepID=A0ABR1VHJ6_9PEZI